VTEYIAVGAAVAIFGFLMWMFGFYCGASSWVNKE